MQAPTSPGVYLLCFERPLAHARHYLGYAENIKKRLARHKAGNGARLLAALNKAGIGWRLARVWEGASRDDERQLKRRKNTPKLCPLCGRGRGKCQKTTSKERSPESLNDQPSK